MAIDFDSMDLLDASLDDLSDRPAFQPFPNGAHICSMYWDAEMNEAGTRMNVIKLKLVYVELGELADTNAKVPEKDDKMTLNMYQFNKDKKTGEEVPSEFGQGAFKDILRFLRPIVGGDTQKEIMKNSQGGQFLFVIKNRKSKDKDGIERINTDITAISEKP